MERDVGEILLIINQFLSFRLQADPRDGILDWLVRVKIFCYWLLFFWICFSFILSSRVVALVAAMK